MQQDVKRVKVLVTGGAGYIGSHACVALLESGHDIVVLDNHSGVRLLSNEANKAGRAITLRLVDATGSDALGATCAIIAGDRRWTQRAMTAYSYCSANDPRVHVGLGEASSVDSVTVLWPDGVSRAFALPEAFGEAAVRQAFTEILAGTYEASWEGLADALEAASGFEADGYVSLWMASVVRPSLDVRWRHDPDEQRLVARVLTDMPHGSLPVTLRVKGRGGVREVPMAVHDGLGRVVVPWDGPAPRRVTVDVGALPVAGTVIREEPGGARASRSAP